MNIIYKSTLFILKNDYRKCQLNLIDIFFSCKTLIDYNYVHTQNTNYHSK